MCLESSDDAYSEIQANSHREITLSRLEPVPIRLLRTPSTPHAVRENALHQPTLPACAACAPRCWVRARRSGCYPETQHTQAAKVQSDLLAILLPRHFFLWE